MRSYFNLTPVPGSRIFFGEIFAVACAMLVNADYDVYFHYVKADGEQGDEERLAQQRIQYFFSTVFPLTERYSSEDGVRFFRNRVLDQAEFKRLRDADKLFLIPINDSHARTFAVVSSADSRKVCFDFSREFTKHFASSDRKKICDLLRDELRDTDLDLKYPLSGRAAFISIRNGATEIEKNITQDSFERMCCALAKQGIRTVVLIGDKLPEDKPRRGDRAAEKGIAIPEPREYQMLFIDFTRYDKLILEETDIPPTALYVAQVYFLMTLKEKYGVKLAVGGNSGGAHMLGSLGIPVVFNRGSARFDAIQYSKKSNPKSTFFPYKPELPDKSDGLEAQLRLAYNCPHAR